MRGALVITAALGLLSVAIISGAQAGSSQSAPTKYSNNPNRVAAGSVIWTGGIGTRPVWISEFSSSTPRGKNSPRR
jgi:hypothetical protein